MKMCLLKCVYVCLCVRMHRHVHDCHCPLVHRLLSPIHYMFQQRKGETGGALTLSHFFLATLLRIQQQTQQKRRMRLQVRGCSA